MKYLDFTDLLDAEPANLAILSTYQLDPDFFERRLLRCPALAKARRILVLLDARQWYNLLRQDAPARFLNRRYLVVPVHRSQGVFHPKLNLLLTEQGGQVLCGSNNLTRSGCSSNLELLNAFTFGGEGDSEEAIPLAQEAFGFFRRACDDGEQESARIARAWLDEARKVFHWLAQPLPPNGGRRVRLVHTYEGSLWDRLATALGAARPSRLLVISPFHDQDGEMLKRIQRRWPDCSIEVVVQQQITNLPVKALKELQPSVSLSELRNSSRRLHAKLVAWEGQGGTGCLTGSANFTTAAFDARNVETCLQVADAADSVRSLFDKELPKRAVAFEDFEPGSEQEPGIGEGPTTGLKLTSVLLLGEGQFRVSYVAQVPVRPSSLRVAIRAPGEPLARAFAPVPNKECATATVNVPPAALADTHGTILAFLLAESHGQRQESDAIWVIQEHRLTYEPSGESSSSAKQKVEETGEGLTELLEEIGKRDGPGAVAEFLRHFNIRFNDGGSGLALGRNFRLRVHDPFHPDVAPEWLINFKSQAENLAEAIKDFVERHEKRRLRVHASKGNINGMENFLDIFTAMVRLLYVYYVRGRGMEKAYVTKHQLVHHLVTFIEIATAGFDTETDSSDGFLTSISDHLDDAEVLQEVSDATHFAGNIRAALMIAQKLRFVPNDPSLDPPPKRAREGLSTTSKKVTNTFAEVGLDEPAKKDILEALEKYRMFTDKDMAEFRNELEGR
jgi:hypothetical protein